MHCLAGIVLISAVAGCKRDEARVYHVPKDDAPATPATQSAPMAAAPQMALPTATAIPKLNYQLPAGWQEKPPAEMRVASFIVPGPDGQSADVSVIPLDVQGHDLELINMWRSQVQLPITTDADAVKQAEPVTIGTEQGRMFNFASEQPIGGNSRQRIIVAMMATGGRSWFFKMAGDDALVASQKPVFVDFLKSVRLEHAATTPVASAPAVQSDNSKSVWAVPAGWQLGPPSPFLYAKYNIADASGTAAVNVSQSPGEGGGLEMNVTRWRGQLGLPPITEIPTTSFAVPGGKATLVDYTGMDAKTGKPARLIGVLVPDNGQTWFYKLMGDPQTVEQQKDAFTKFIQSANYANAR